MKWFCLFVFVISVGSLSTMDDIQKYEMSDNAMISLRMNNGYLTLFDRRECEKMYAKLVSLVMFEQNIVDVIERINQFVSDYENDCNSMIEAIDFFERHDIELTTNNTKLVYAVVINKLINPKYLRRESWNAIKRITTEDGIDRFKLLISQCDFCNVSENCELS